MRHSTSWTLGGGLILGGALATWAHAGGTLPTPEPPSSKIADELDLLGRRLRDLGYASLPIEHPRGGYPTVQADVAGQKLRLILDTGCLHSALDRDRTSALRLAWSKVRGEAHVASDLWDNNNRSEISLLTLGAAKVQQVTVSQIFLRDVNAIMTTDGDPQVDGVLGSDVLTAVGAVIDYPGGRLYVRPGPARASSWLDGVQAFDTRKVRLPVAPTQVHAKELARFRLWVSPDRGKTWERAGDYAPTATELRYDAPRDGEYWMATQSVGHDGLTNPAGQDKLVAYWKVRVDTSPRPSGRPAPPPADLRAEADALRAEVDRLRQRVRELEASGKK